MRYNAIGLFLFVLLGLFGLSACGQPTNDAQGTAYKPLEHSKYAPPTYDLGPVNRDAYKAYEAPALAPLPSLEPSQTKALEPQSASKPKPKGMTCVPGDDDCNGTIHEDESGWDCKAMGNHQCGQTRYVQAEDGSWVPESFYDKPASKTLEPSGKACRGKPGSDIGSGDDNRDGWVSPGESGYEALC